jgi:hypothetical protein
MAAAGEIRIASDKDRTRRILSHGGKRRVDLAFVGCPQQLELQAKRATRCLNFVEFQFGIRIGRIHEGGNGRGVRRQIVQQSQPLRRKNISEKCDAGDIAVRAIET